MLLLNYHALNSLWNRLAVFLICPELSKRQFSIPFAGNTINSHFPKVTRWIPCENRNTPWLRPKQGIKGQRDKLWSRWCTQFKLAAGSHCQSSSSGRSVLVLFQCYISGKVILGLAGKHRINYSFKKPNKYGFLCCKPGLHFHRKHLHLKNQYYLQSLCISEIKTKGQFGGWGGEEEEALFFAVTIEQNVLNLPKKKVIRSRLLLDLAKGASTSVFTVTQWLTVCPVKAH